MVRACPPRAPTASPAPTAVTTSRPERRPSSSAIASAAGIASEPMWRMDSLCMSSSSNACPAVPLTSAASDAEVFPSIPISVDRGRAPSLIARSATLRVQGSVAPNRQHPKLSSAQSLMRSTTSRGRSSKRKADANAARSRVAFSFNGGLEALIVQLVLAGRNPELGHRFVLRERFHQLSFHPRAARPQDQSILEGLRIAVQPVGKLRYPESHAAEQPSQGIL